MSGEQARDPRRTTFLKVNIRSDHGWTEAIVCNISAHGMMLSGLPVKPWQMATPIRALGPWPG